MKKLFAAMFALLLFCGAGRAQETVNQYIDIYDAVLKPFGNHIIARHYKLWDGRSHCALGQTARLVIAFHGGHQSADIMKGYQPPQGCYVYAYLSGSNKDGPLQPVRVSGDDLLWNTYSDVERGWPGENGVDDNLFVNSVVNKLKADYGITKVFGVGPSRGGMMTYHFACTSTLFAAIATIASKPLGPDCNPAVHVPTLHVHGTADTEVCWELTGWYCSPWGQAKPAVIDQWLAVGTHPAPVILPGGTHKYSPDDIFDTAGAVRVHFDAQP